MTANTVLLVTASYDEAAKYVAQALHLRQVPFFRLDTDRLPTEVEASFDPQGDITFADGDQSVSGKDVKSVWYRRNVAPNLPTELSAGTREFCQREARAFLEGTLSTLPTERWLSFPHAIWRAERKPYQLAVAAQLGFVLPRTIVTNRAKIAQDFAQGRRIVVKAVSSGYIAGPEGNQAIFTSAIDHSDLQDLSGLPLAPVTFQEKIEKSSDIRVTVVGNEVFSAEIRQLTVLENEWSAQYRTKFQRSRPPDQREPLIYGGSTLG